MGEKSQRVIYKDIQTNEMDSKVRTHLLGYFLFFFSFSSNLLRVCMVGRGKGEQLKYNMHPPAIHYKLKLCN